MTDARCLLVIRIPHHLNQSTQDQIREDAAELRERLQDQEHPIVFLGDGVHAYWLRPGESTVEADARADAIRANTTEEVAE